MYIFKTLKRFLLSDERMKITPDLCTGASTSVALKKGGDSWQALDKGLPSEPRYTNVLRFVDGTASDITENIMR